MNVLPLQSGSNGNCICVEAGGVTLLFDAGSAAGRLRSGLQYTGAIRKVDALVISHDHIDTFRARASTSESRHAAVYNTEDIARGAIRARPWQSW